MNPPRNNNLKNDVSFYLWEKSQRPLAIDMSTPLLRELFENYGKNEVETEINRQKLAKDLQTAS